MSEITQQESVEKLLQLIKENPTLRIVPMVEMECVASDDFAWWVCRWGKASIEEIYTPQETCYVRSASENIVADEIFERLEEEHPEWTDEMIGMIVDEEIEEVWEKVIAIKIMP